MSLNTLNGLQNEATALRKTCETLESRASWVAHLRSRAKADRRIYPPFVVKTSYGDGAHQPRRTAEVEAAFQAAIAPFEDDILATMEINFRTEAKKAMMRAEAIEARIAASVTLPEPLP